MRHLFIFTALILSLSACGAGTGAFDNGAGNVIDLPSNTQDAVQIGNPNGGPVTTTDTTKSAVAAHLEKNDTYTGTSMIDGEAGVIYICRFDVSAMKASISRNDRPDVNTVGFKINDDGSIETVDALEGYDISSDPVADVSDISLDIDIVNPAGDLVSVLKLFSGDIETIEYVEDNTPNQFGGIGASCMDGHCTEGL